MAKLVFPCGCKFKIVNDDTDRDIPVASFDKLPRVDISLNPWEENSIYRVSTACDAVWNMIGEGKTKGVFQLEASLGRQWSKKTQPRSIEDLGALVALLRPGCLRAMSGDPPKSMTQRYADRKMGREEVAYLHKSIETVLETTYGVLTYQEQAMRIVEVVALFNKQEADALRKAIGKKKADAMAKVEKEFLEKAEKAGIVTLDEAKEIFGWIRESQKYSFNKSHAVAYGEDAYWSAYIKAHFPLTFYGAWILGANWKNSEKFEEIAELLNDAKLNNIEVKVPQLYSLTEHTDIINDEFVQFGLTEIKGVGGSTAKKILANIDNIKELDKPIKDLTWMEFLLFVAPKLGKVASTALISVGALDYMDKIPRNKKLYEYKMLLEQVKDGELQWMQSRWKENNWPTFIDALTAVKPVRKMEKKVWVGGGGTSSKTREEKINSVISLLQTPPTKLNDTIEWIALTEEKYFGTPVTTSKIDGVEEACEANTTCKEFLAGKDGYSVFAVEVVKVEETRTKKGKKPGSKMAKLIVRDSSCSIEAIVFPKQWAEFGTSIYEGNTILAIGERTREGSLSIKKAKEIG
jgi:DNA polymerase III alpha subunit